MEKNPEFRRSFQYNAARHWNNLSPQAKMARTLLSFKKEIVSKRTSKICKYSFLSFYVLNISKHNRGSLITWNDKGKIDVSSEGPSSGS